MDDNEFNELDEELAEQEEQQQQYQLPDYGEIKQQYDNIKNITEQIDKFRNGKNQFNNGNTQPNKFSRFNNNSNIDSNSLPNHAKNKLENSNNNVNDEFDTNNINKEPKNFNDGFDENNVNKEPKSFNDGFNTNNINKEPKSFNDGFNTNNINKEPKNFNDGFDTNNINKEPKNFNDGFNTNNINKEPNNKVNNSSSEVGKQGIEKNTPKSNNTPEKIKTEMGGVKNVTTPGGTGVAPVGMEGAAAGVEGTAGSAASGAATGVESAAAGTTSAGISGVFEALGAALPYIALVIIIIIVIFIVIIVIIAVIHLIDEKISVPRINIDYCDSVNIRWLDEQTQEEKSYDFSSDEYVAYEIHNSQFNIIDDQNTMEALSVVYRSNLYANTDNIQDKICYIESEKAVLEEELDENYQNILKIVKNTSGYIFSFSQDYATKLEIDDYFSYNNVKKDSDKKDVYVLSQDKFTYEKAWIDSHVPNEYIHQDSPEHYSFPPFAAWYLSATGEFDYHSLLYHFYTPDTYDAHLFKVQDEYEKNGDILDGTSQCGDISLTNTKFSREEFIEKVKSFNSGYSSYKIFKENAGLIYDISVKNNFNPEMVVIRAQLEGYSPGTSYNYWGIGCANNHPERCGKYGSFDEGVLAYITTAQKINSTSLYQMQYKYSYIGSNWFNPGDSRNGGCHYFKYVKKYLSEDRASTVEPYCAPGNTCSGSNCLKTTDEDQAAYTRWQMENSLITREQIFGISATECDDETVGQNKISSIGEAVAKYAVETYDSWLYSQPQRDKEGYVDCSSMVKRAYQHFNVRIYDSSYRSDQIYLWCELNEKVIESSNLAPGDLIFKITSRGQKEGHHLGIGHVEMYIGNGKTFAAHDHYPSHPEDDVSITNYKNNGNFFCRPTKK